MTPMTEDEARTALTAVVPPAGLAVDPTTVLVGGRRVIRKRRLAVVATVAVMALVGVLTPKLLGLGASALPAGFPEGGITARFEPEGNRWGCAVTYDPSRSGDNVWYAYIRPDGSTGPDVGRPFPLVSPTTHINMVDWGVPALAGVAPGAVTELHPVNKSALSPIPVRTKPLGATGLRAFCAQATDAADTTGSTMIGTTADHRVLAGADVYTVASHNPERTVFLIPALKLVGAFSWYADYSPTQVIVAAFDPSAEVFVELGTSPSLNSAIAMVGVLPAGARHVVVHTDTGQAIPATATDLAGTAYSVIEWNAADGQVVGKTRSVTWMDATGASRTWRAGDTGVVPAYRADEACDLNATDKPGPAGTGLNAPTKPAHPMTRDEALAAARALADGGAAAAAGARATAIQLPYEATQPAGGGAASRAPSRCTWAVTVEAAWTRDRGPQGSTPTTYPYYTLLADVATGAGLEISAGPGIPNYVTGTHLYPKQVPAERTDAIATSSSPR